MQQTRIAFIGAGNMASAIIGGLINSGTDAAHIYAADPYPASLDKLKTLYGVHTSNDNNAIIAEADVVILAVKPQQLKQVCSEIKTRLIQQNPLIISIAAGIPSSALETWLDRDLAIIRCMPNTPALIRQAACALFANNKVSHQQKALASQLLHAIGTVDWVDNERLIDAVTAVSGSGPAYFFLVMEMMINAGIELGLDAEIAKNISLQTALGAANMAINSDVDVAELRRRVTSPGGTTQAAIESFEHDGIRQMFSKALAAADARSQSLAKELQ